MKSKFSQHLPINPWVYHGFTPLKIPRGIPPGDPPGHGLALLLQRQLRRQRRGLRLLGVCQAAAAQEILELGQQRHGAPSMDGELRADPGDGRVEVSGWFFWGLEWNIWNEFKDMN